MNTQTDQPEIESEDLDAGEESLADQAEAIDQGAEIEQLRAKADENWDRYLRAAAEVENVRKRAARDVEHARKYALENFSRDLLDVKDSLEMGIADVDIVYSTRLQEERFNSPAEADMYRGRFRLNQGIYTANCEPNTVIMHPLPRDSREGAQELDVDLNDNPNLAIFRQSDNGVLVRMALFALILDVVDQVDAHSRPVNWYTERRF